MPKWNVTYLYTKLLRYHFEPHSFSDRSKHSGSKRSTEMKMSEERLSVLQHFIASKTRTISKLKRYASILLVRDASKERNIPK